MLSPYDSNRVGGILGCAPLGLWIPRWRLGSDYGGPGHRSPDCALKEAL